MLPAATTFVSATDGGSESGGTVTWPLGFLSPGDGGFRKVTVMIDGGVAPGDVIPATAVIAAVADPGNNASSQINTAVTTTAGLQIEFETNVTPVRSSDLVQTALTVTNHDPFTRFGVVIEGYFPQNLNQLFESENDVNCSGTTCNATERMIWTLGDIPAGGSVTKVIAPTVTAGTTGGVLINIPLTASDVAGFEDRTLLTLRVQNDTLYDLSLAENRDPAPANTALVYSIDFAYRSDAASVSNSVLRLPLPAGTTFVSASDGGSVSGGAVEWPLGFLSPGQSGTRTATLMLDAGLGNGAIVNAEALLSSVTSPLERAAAQAATVIASSGGLRLAIESNTHPIRAGEGGYIQLTACNTDPFTRFGITLNTIFPEALNQQFESEFEGDCASTTCNAGEALQWTLGNLLAGACTTTSFFPVPTAGTPSGTLIPFFVLAEDDAGLQTRRTESYRTDNDSKYDLALAEYTDPARAGSTLTYLLSFAHRVDAAAVSNTTMRFPLPAGTTFVSATDGGVLTSGVVEWNLGFLSPGDGGQREVTVTIGAGTVAGTVLEAEAVIASVTTPLQNTRAEANTTIATNNDLQIAIEPNANPGRQQELINYRMTVSNLSPFSRFGVTLTGGYPQDLDQVFESTFDGDCASTTCSFGELVTWSLGDIPPGVAKSVDLPPVIAFSATEGELINFFTKAQDDQGTQAQQLASVRVQGDTLYDLAMNVSADPVTAGSTISYQIVYGYRQDAGVANNSRIRLPLPAGATFVSATGGGVF